MKKRVTLARGDTLAQSDNLARSDFSVPRHFSMHVIILILLEFLLKNLTFNYFQFINLTNK